MPAVVVEPAQPVSAIAQTRNHVRMGTMRTSVLYCPRDCQYRAALTFRGRLDRAALDGRATFDAYRYRRRITTSGSSGERDITALRTQVGIEIDERHPQIENRCHTSPRLHCSLCPARAQSGFYLSEKAYRRLNRCPSRAADSFEASALCASRRGSLAQ